MTMTNQRRKERYYNRVVHDVTEKILVAMEDQQLSTITLAKRLGTTPDNLNQLLQSEKTFDLEMLCAVAFELRLELSTLVSER